MKSKYFIIVIVLIIFNISTTYSQNTRIFTRNDSIPNYIWVLGISVPINLHFNSGTYIPNQEFCNCNEMSISNFDISSGLGISSEIYYHNIDWFPYFDSLSFGSSIRMNFTKNSFTGEGEEDSRKVNFQGELTDLFERSLLEVDASYFDVLLGFTFASPLFGIVNDSLRNDVPSMYFTIGPSFSFLLNQDAKRYSEIVKPEEFVYLDGTQKKLITDAGINNLNSFRVGITMLYGYNWYLNQIFPNLKIHNLLVSSEVGFNYYFIAPFEDTNTIDPTLFAKFSVKWQFDIIMFVKK